MYVGDVAGEEYRRGKRISKHLWFSLNFSLLLSSLSDRSV